jgi:hypothetical protein
MARVWGGVGDGGFETIQTVMLNKAKSRISNQEYRQLISSHMLEDESLQYIINLQAV